MRIEILDSFLSQFLRIFSETEDSSMLLLFPDAFAIVFHVTSHLWPIWNSIQFSFMLVLIFATDSFRWYTISCSADITNFNYAHTHTHWFAFSYYRNESCRLHLMGVETIDYTFYVHAYTLFRTIFHRLALLMFFSLRSHPRIMSIISSNFHPSVSHIIVQTVQRIAGLAMKCCA